MNIVLNERQQQILERLNAEGEVKIADLKETFAVTEMTIRRDLEKLEAAGYAKRTFGGAIVFGNDIALQERSGYMTEEKRRIGKRAAERVLPGESIFIDGGSTTLQVARYLKPAARITVVTNALNVAAELTGKQIPVIVTGGTLLETTGSLVGPIAAGTVAGMAFDRIFLGASGVSLLHGFSNSNVYEAEIKKLAIRQSSEVNVVLDHSKFGEKELVSFASFADVHRIIADDLPDDELARVVREAGVEIELG
ncbi:DeoR/GlpR family DNA-binding transcription regulator [Paenibacillus nasutitermitis]|uniref:DeoR family transcriptional regulator n=1 Tax=Paenibacillus nasutitermitis TaxID=1652958 RepID=A0A916ZBE0_9BACL|nr:DeoR/GlpR family DNA-binding transcription regulator [Paenibacillus nasutitermitis]GGD86271.1 DeoR family transcriptional regulator [Paenibacillus nasutitermitis]